MTDTKREALVGGWRLIAAVRQCDDGETRDELGAHPDGYLTYTEQGTVSAVLGSATRPKGSAQDPQEASPEEYAGMARQFLAYAGRYTIDSDEGDVTPHIEIALFPGWQGQGQARKLVLEGDQLTIQASPRTGPDGRTFHVRLVWRRADSEPA